MTKKKIKFEKHPDEIKFEKWLKEKGEFLGECWRELKKSYKKMMNWYFFYNDHKGDKGDKALHIFAVLAVDIIILKIFEII